MFIGYLHCERCDYRTDAFMCMYHHWRDGYHVPVQDQVTLAIRLVHVPDDDVFYPIRDEQGGTDREHAVSQYVAALKARCMSETEKEIPVLDLIRDDPVHVPCPRCRARLRWHTTGIT